MNQIMRCKWSESDPLLRDYHDHEWGIPVRDGRAMWECLMLEGFQAGLSWLTILRKRDAFRAGFRDFDPELVARFDERNVQRLLADEGIIRSRAKIRATIRGAQLFLDYERDGGFAQAMWAYTEGRPLVNRTGEVPAKTPLSEQISADLRRRGFKFVGPVIVYAWMQAVGMVDDHAPGCFRANGRV